jgi:hypothetical protein
MIDLVKNNLVSTAAVITAVSVIIGSAFAVESRYAKAEQIAQVKQETQMMLDFSRKQQLEDKLFELRLKPNPDSVTLAMIKRYEEQLREVTRRLQR